MNTIEYSIVEGSSPFVVELVDCDKPIEKVYTLGTHYFYKVPDGLYVLKITDSNGCIYENQITVNPTISTTTTTVVPGDFISVGNTQDIASIFSNVATNRDSQYTGYPDPNAAVLYLWFKTSDGKPLVNNKTFQYTICADVENLTSFDFVSLSDEINVDIIETIAGPSESISGNITLKTNFIESLFQYKYSKGVGDPSFKILMESINPMFDVNVVTTGVDGKLYGISSLNTKQVNFNY